MADDFLLLAKLARATSDVLADDTELAAELAPALDSARAALRVESTDLVALAAELESAADRRRCAKASTAARELEQEADEALATGRAERAARLGRRASRMYDHGMRLAERLLRAQDGRAPSWSVPLDGLDGALLSVWVEPGPAPAVYTVGSEGASGDDTGPLFLRSGAEGWVRVPVASSGSLWWVHGIPDGPVFTCGTEGRAYRYDPRTGQVRDLSTGIAATLYGIWGLAENDMWCVGGSVDGSGPRTVLLRHDGTSWTPMTPPDAENRTLYKVWGAAADDVWICGQGGYLAHWDGAAWTSVASGTPASLFTVHGGPTPLVAVGGLAPVIVEPGAGGAWSEVATPQGDGGLLGVFVRPSGEGVACGYGATVFRRQQGTWTALQGLPASTGRDFHAAAIDERGGVWLAGGDLFQLRRGSLLYFGTRTLPRDVLPQALLRRDVAPILDRNCAFIGCHTPPFHNAGLDLADAETMHANTVGAPSQQSPLARVLPGRPSQSYLWHKLEGTQLSVGGEGDQMPQGATLAQSELDVIRAWIVEGALDD